MRNGRQERASEGLVGRRGELELLRQSFEEARPGHLRIVTVAGDAGIGKSRLIEEFTRRRVSGTVTLSSACYEGEGVPPLWPWVQIVRAACELSDGAHLDDVPASVKSVLCHKFPDLCAGPPDAPPPEIEPVAARFALFEAVSRLIGEVARNAATLIVFDDLHWADVDSLLLLQFLAKQHRSSPLMILVTYRDLEAERAEAVQRIVTDIERTSGAQRVLLKGLERNDCEVLARQVCASQVPEALLHSIWESSEGNPLFVQELARAAAEGETPPDSVPGSLRGVIDRRLADLPANTRDLLRIASVIGREFEVSLLQRVARRAAAEMVDTLADALDRAIRLRVIERVRSSGGYRFRHALIRESLYEQLPGSTRVHLHGLTAAAIEETTAGRLDRHSADLAHHYYEAALGGWARQAVEYNCRAGDYAYSVAAFSEAARRFAAALQVIDLTEKPAAKDRCEILVRLGHAAFLSGDTQAAQTHLEEAADLARDLGEAELFGEAVFTMHGVWGTAGTSNPDYVRLLEEALERLPVEDGNLRVGLTGRLATELYWTPQQQRREELGREIVAMARRLGQPQVVARALNAARFALWRPDNAEERHAMSRENILYAEQAGDRFLAAGGLVWLVIDSLELGRMSEAGAAIDAYGVQAAQLQSPFFQWQHGVLETMRALVAGDLEEAERLALSAFEAGSGVQGTNADLFFGLQMVQLRWHQGRLGELEDSVRDFVRRFPALPSWRAALAFILSEQDKLDEARRELGGFATDSFAAIPRDANFLISMALLGEVCAAVGDAERARILYDLLQPYSTHVVVVGNGASCWGAVGYFLGRLAVGMSDDASAARHFRAAVELHERIGALPHLALSQCHLAAVLARDATSAAEATQLLRQAREYAERTGMKRLQQLAERIEVGEVADTPSVVGPTTGPGEWLFRADGDFWAVGSPEHPLRLRRRKGLEYVSYLIRNAGREILATDLEQVGHEVCDAVAAGIAGEASVRPAADLGDAGEMLDARARGDYKRRLTELRAELDEAERFNDIGRAERAGAEIEELTAELSRAVGLSGRSRKAASHAERARINVTRAIKKTISLIAKHDPALAHHLTGSIRTGRFCSYTADPARPMRWAL